MCMIVGKKRTLVPRDDRVGGGGVSECVDRGQEEPGVIYIDPLFIYVEQTTFSTFKLLTVAIAAAIDTAF